ncbi:hypothetical protein ACWDRB_25035 [Nonomuraea sp. NPDC003707]
MRLIDEFGVKVHAVDADVLERAADLAAWFTPRMLGVVETTILRGVAAG